MATKRLRNYDLNDLDSKCTDQLNKFFCGADSKQSKITRLNV